MRDDDVKKNMFGQVTMPADTGEHEPNTERLYQAFEKPGRSVVWMFCRKCNRYIELTEQLTKFFNKENDEVIAMTSFEGYYFETNGCFRCRDGQPNIVLKEIPMH